jgi:hypothetical protein
VILHLEVLVKAATKGLASLGTGGTGGSAPAVAVTDEASLLAALRHHWEHAATDQEISHEIYHDDAVLEFPQSQERFVGKENFKAWRSIYPASLEFNVGRIRGRGDLWVAENSIRYDGGPWNYACSILEIQRRQGGPGDHLHHPRVGCPRVAGQMAHAMGRE